MIKFIVLCSLLLISVSAKRASYDGYNVYKITPKTIQQRDVLNAMRDEFDFWNYGTVPQVMVPPLKSQHFEAQMEKYDIKYDKMIEDVERMTHQKVASEFIGNMTWTEYHTLESINTWMDFLELRYPGIVQSIYYGISYEGIYLRALKISYGTGKRTVFIEGGIHAREWISPATVTYIINSLLTSEDPKVSSIARSFDWYILPVANPDGYVYSHTTDRMWRKTRTNYVDCFGADPNRNWDFHWGEHSTSTDCSSIEYGGPSIFSEAETFYLSSFLKTISETLDIYLTFHSFSQVFLIPYGNTSDHLGNYEDTLAIGKNAITKLAAKYGTKYEVGNNAEVLYKNSGTSRDWVKEKLGTPIVYTVELRDKGEYGFLLPEDQILPNCEEIMDSLIGLFEEAERLGYVTLEKN